MRKHIDEKQERLKKLEDGGRFDENKDYFISLFSTASIEICGHKKRNRGISVPSNKTKSPQDYERVKGDDPAQIRRKMNELRKVVELNTPDRSKVIAFTLTYFDHLAIKKDDYKLISKDISRFMKGINYRFNKIYNNIEYIIVRELTGNMVYHLHGLLIANKSDIPFHLEKEDIDRYWHKIGEIIDVRDATTIKNHLASYLIPHKTNSTNSYAMDMNVKAERVKMMPFRAKYYTCSISLMKPLSVQITEKDALEIVKGLEELYPIKIKNYFLSSIYDGSYASEEIEKRMFALSEDKEVRMAFVEKLYQLLKEKKKLLRYEKYKSNINDYNRI